MVSGCILRRQVRVYEDWSYHDFSSTVCLAVYRCHPHMPSCSLINYSFQAATYRWYSCMSLILAFRSTRTINKKVVWLNPTSILLPKTSIRNLWVRHCPIRHPVTRSWTEEITYGVSEIINSSPKDFTSVRAYGDREARELRLIGVQRVIKEISTFFRPISSQKRRQFRQDIDKVLCRAKVRAFPWYITVFHAWFVE
jgi:hypothetical protein